MAYKQSTAVGDLNVAFLRDRINALPESVRNEVRLLHLMMGANPEGLSLQCLLQTTLARCAISDVDPANLAPSELIRAVVRAIDVQPCIVEAPPG
jgi:hypothetical protein